MASRAKRLENLESALTPTGRPFVIWGMAGMADELALKSERDIEAEIAAARSSGRMGINDQLVIVRWRTEPAE